MILDFKEKINDKELKRCAESIKNGNLVIFPTETIYGIGADGLNETAVKKIYEAKGRKSDNPLILHISNKNMINDIAKNIGDIELKLIDAFFPGPLTIIFEKKDCVPSIVTGGLDTVAVRMPSNEIANKLIEYANTPIAAPSANVSGRPSGTNVSDIIDELGSKVDYIIDGGDSKIGVESTVIRVIDGNIHILRPGYITFDMLSLYAPVIVDEHVLGELKKDDIVLSPGMKYTHYAPNTKCVMVYSDDKEKMIAKMKEFNIDNTLVICNEENTKYFNNAISYGKNLQDIAHNIFKILREVDKYNKDLVIIEGVTKDGLGLAIMNRLIRSCSHNYIEL